MNSLLTIKEAQDWWVCDFCFCQYKGFEYIDYYNGVPFQAKRYSYTPIKDIESLIHYSQDKVSLDICSTCYWSYLDRRRHHYSPHQLLQEPTLRIYDQRTKRFYDYPFHTKDELKEIYQF